MRSLAVFLAAVLLGGLVVHGQETPEIEREIERLTELLRARAKRARAPEAQLPVLRVYDVSDCLTPVQDEVLEPTNVHRSRGGSAEAEEVERDGPFEIDVLIELVRFTVEPESWDTIEGADLQPKGTRLLARTIPRVHGKIAKLFRMLREQALAQVRVDVVAVPVPAAEAAALAERPRDLEPEQARRLLAQAPLGRVQVVCREGQQVVQRSGTSHAYLQDFDVEIAQAASIGDPVRRSLFGGLAAEVRPLLDRGGKGVLLHLRLERTFVREPMRRAETEHGALELPEMDLTRVNTSLWAPLGRTVVAGGSTAGEDPCVFLVTARLEE